MQKLRLRIMGILLYKNKNHSNGSKSSIRMVYNYFLKIVSYYSNFDRMVVCFFIIKY